MTGKLEKAYGRFFAYIKIFVNPFKKVIIHTECQIHKYINVQALEILKNDHFLDAHSFFSDHIASINEGAVWADQDLKSSGHFFHPEKNRGLYGNTNALVLALNYYQSSLDYWKSGDMDQSMFFLGAAVHIVQDMTIPQHANIRLLNNHRQFENFIKRTYRSTPIFSVSKGGYYVESIEEAVRCNARNAIKIYTKLKDIEDSKKRYYTISKFIIPLAQKTTAGCFLRFYKDVGRHRSGDRRNTDTPGFRLNTKT
ncbi:MAG: zinc dependent phospholipase C family protein [Clostridia bacterium]|nr:zinc dependent phospholipase C family protein [Clostridia bacterium]